MWPLGSMLIILIKSCSVEDLFSGVEKVEIVIQQEMIIYVLELSSQIDNTINSGSVHVGG